MGGEDGAATAIALSAKDFSDFQKKLSEDMQKTWSAFQDANDRVIKQMETRAQAETKLVKDIEAFGGRLDQLELLLQQKPAVGLTTVGAELMKEFSTYLRKGIAGPSMQKAMVEGDNTLGGYLAPAEYIREIIKGVVEYSPIRELSRVSTISSSVAQIPKKTGTAGATWLGSETATIPESTGLTYGLEEIPTHFLVSKFPLSMRLVNDSAFDLDAEIRDEVVLDWAIAEGLACINGTGRNQPEGLLTKTGITVVNSGDASTLKPDGLIDLCYTLKDGYARNATWIMRRATMGTVRKMKDPVTGTYVWQPGLLASQPPTILGSPVVNCPDMPVVASSAYPIMFGDFFRGYRIIDNSQSMFLRDNISLADQMQIKYVAARAVGAHVVDNDAFVKQKVST